MCSRHQQVLPAGCNGARQFALCRQAHSADNQGQHRGVRRANDADSLAQPCHWISSSMTRAWRWTTCCEQGFVVKDVGKLGSSFLALIIFIFIRIWIPKAPACRLEHVLVWMMPVRMPTNTLSPLLQSVRNAPYHLSASLVVLMAPLSRSRLRTWLLASRRRILPETSYHFFPRSMC